jgi:alanyl-tRNA synthetase
MANHTATHLLQKALQEVLGDHVRQAGSAVRPDKLRFDFTHPQQLKQEERAEVERLVNHEIAAAKPVLTFTVPIAEARELGAMMLFGEKYGDIVRVVEVPGFSRELCGGTHVRSTAEIGSFAITSESSVGSGARRIEAVTAADAYELLRARADEADDLRAELERVKREAKQRKPAAPLDDAVGPLVAGAKDMGGIKVVAAQIEGMNADALLELSDRVKQKAGPSAVVLASHEDGRVHLIVNFDPTLEQRGLDAVKVIREAAALVGGGGGGRATMARAGGRDPAKLPDALAMAERLILEGLA